MDHYFAQTCGCMDMSVFILYKLLCTGTYPALYANVRIRTGLISVHYAPLTETVAFRISAVNGNSYSPWLPST